MAEYTFEHYNPHANQLKYHNSWARERIVISSIRAGKTYGIIHDLMMNAWNAPDKLATALACAPTTGQTRDLLYEPFKTLALDIGLYKRSTSQQGYMEVELCNNKRVCFRTLNSTAADTVRGMTCDMAYVDEAALCSEESINIVRGRLVTTQGRLSLATTPKGKSNWLYQAYFAPGAPQRPSTEIFRYSIYDNPAITPEAVNHLKSIYSELMFRQEVLGEFVSLNTNAVYYEFSPAKNVSDEAVLPFDPFKEYKNWPIYAGIDYNVEKNPVILAYKRSDGVIVVFDEIYGCKSTADMGRAIIARFPNRNSSNILIIDDASSGNAHSQLDFRTNRQQLNQLGLSRIVQTSSNPRRLNRYANVNAHLNNAMGNSRLIINPKCTNLIRDLADLEFRKNSDEPDTVNNLLGHASDALGYLIMYASPWAGNETSRAFSQNLNIGR